MSLVTLLGNHFSFHFISLHLHEKCPFPTVYQYCTHYTALSVEILDLLYMFLYLLTKQKTKRKEKSLH